MMNFRTCSNGGRYTLSCVLCAVSRDDGLTPLTRDMAMWLAWNAAPHAPNPLFGILHRLLFALPLLQLSFSPGVTMMMKGVGGT